MLAGISARRSGAVAGAGAGAGTRQLCLPSRRQLSSFVRTAPLRPSKRGYGVLPNGSSTSSRSVVQTARTVRFSSSTAAPAAVSPAAANVSPAPDAVSDTSTITDAGLVDLSSIPEQMGYMKMLGLDYGWGPSAVTQTLIEALHIYGGLPWVATAIAVPFIYRAIMFQPSIVAAEQTARAKVAKSQLDPVRMNMLECQKAGDMQGFARAKQEQLRISHLHGLQAWKLGLPLINIPLGFASFRVLRGMGELPVPGLESESLWWLQDLTVSDPIYVLPLVISASLHLAMKRNVNLGLSQVNSDSPAGKIMIYGLPCFSLIFISALPGILQLNFATASLLSLGQTYLMTNAAFRDYMSLPALAKKEEPRGRIKKKTINTTVTSPDNVSSIDRAVDGFKNFFSDLKNQITRTAGYDPSNTAEPKENEAQQRGLSKEEFDLAKAYEEKRRQELAEERERRNRQLKEEYMNKMKQNNSRKSGKKRERKQGK